LQAEYEQFEPGALLGLVMPWLDLWNRFRLSQPASVNNISGPEKASCWTESCLRPKALPYVAKGHP
jgi:hypothetical protein